MLKAPMQVQRKEIFGRPAQVKSTTALPPAAHEHELAAGIHPCVWKPRTRSVQVIGAESNPLSLPLSAYTHLSGTRAPPACGS